MIDSTHIVEPQGIGYWQQPKMLPKFEDLAHNLVGSIIVVFHNKEQLHVSIQKSFGIRWFFEAIWTSFYKNIEFVWRHPYNFTCVLPFLSSFTTFLHPSDGFWSYNVQYDYKISHIWNHKILIIFLWNTCWNDVENYDWLYKVMD